MASIESRGYASPQLDAQEIAVAAAHGAGQAVRELEGAQIGR